MQFTRWKVGAVVLLAACSLAGLAIWVIRPAQDRAVGDVKARPFTPDGRPAYVNVYSADPNADQQKIADFVNASVMPRLGRRIEGLGVAGVLGQHTSTLRIRPNPERLRAYGVSPEDVREAVRVTRMIGPEERLSRPAIEWPQSKEFVLTYNPERFGKIIGTPEGFGNIVLKANAEGEVLRLGEVCEVGMSPESFDIRPEIRGRPAAAVVLKPLPGRDVVAVIEAVREEFEQARKGSLLAGLGFEIIPPEDPGMIDAVIETSWDLPLEYTDAVCRELAAIARGIEGVASVSSLAGYDIRTEARSPNAGTCLIRLKGRPDRKLTTRQIIEKLAEKCRAKEIDPDCFEPTAVSAFVAAGGFSVRILDRAKAAGRPATSPEDLLNRQDLEGIFTSLAVKYPQHELVIDNDAAMRRGVSIAGALLKLPEIVESEVQSKRATGTFVEDPSKLTFEDDRGERIPYRSFLRFRAKPKADAVDR